MGAIENGSIYVSNSSKKRFSFQHSYQNILTFEHRLRSRSDKSAYFSVQEGKHIDSYSNGLAKTAIIVI